AKPICLRLFWQDIRRAASRAAWTAGNSSPTRMPMIAITTNSSTSVKPEGVRSRRGAPADGGAGTGERGAAIGETPKHGKRAPDTTNERRAERSERGWLWSWLRNRKSRGLGRRSNRD